MKKIILLMSVIVALSTIVYGDDDFTPIPPYNPNALYQLYPTQNMWTFLKLNTMTGEAWQVQFSTQGEDYRLQRKIEGKNILPTDTIVGRYILYPSRNIYNFVLLDQIDGLVYQVQWNVEGYKRLYIPILPVDAENQQIAPFKIDENSLRQHHFCIVEKIKASKKSKYIPVKAYYSIYTYVMNAATSDNRTYLSIVQEVIERYLDHKLTKQFEDEFNTKQSVEDKIDIFLKYY